MKKSANFKRPKHVLKDNRGVVLRTYRKPKSTADRLADMEVYFNDMMREHIRLIEQQYLNQILFGRTDVNITNDSST